MAADVTANVAAGIPALAPDRRPPQAEFTVWVSGNPFAAHQRAPQRVAAGARLSDLADPAWHPAVRIWIDGDEVPPAMWSRVRPRPGAPVFLRAPLQGPGVAVALGAALAGSLGTATGAAFGAAIGGSILGVSMSVVLGAVGGAVFSTAASWAANALFAPGGSGAGRARRESDTPAVFALQGARNALRPYAPVPVVLGRHRVVPPWGAAPWTEIRGRDQFLRVLAIWGYGPISLSSVRIGNTPIGDYDGVRDAHDLTGNAATLKLYPSEVEQEDLSVALSTSYVERTTPRSVTEIGVTITFPSGLYELDRKNNRVTRNVGLTIQYRISGGAWTDWVDGTDTEKWTRNAEFAHGDAAISGLIKARSSQPVRVAFQATDLPDGTYEVRIKRETAESTETTVRDACVWTALRSVRETTPPVSLPSVAKSAYVIKASDQLNGVVDELNAIVRLKAATWNGSSWTGSTETSNPAAIYRWVLTSDANPKPIPTSKIDDDALGDWYEFCEDLTLRYERIVDFPIAVPDLLEEIAAAGFAAPQRIDGKWSVIVDRARDSVVQHFTPRNTRGFTGAVTYQEAPHAMRVRFNNRFRDYEVDEITVYDDGYDAGSATKFQTLELPGVTAKQHAHRMARHVIAQARLRPERWSFEVDVENLLAVRGDLVRLSHDVALIGQVTGRVTAIAGSVVTLDEQVTMEAGSFYRLRVRQADATDSEHVVVVSPGTTNDVTVTSATGIAVGDLVTFGEYLSDSVLALIEQIEPLDDLAARVDCIPYAEAIYDASSSIPEYDTVISEPVSASFTGPPPPVIEAVATDDAAMIRTAGGDVVPGIFVAVSPGRPMLGTAKTERTSHFVGRWRPRGADEAYSYTAPVDAAAERIEMFPVETGEVYDIGVRAIGADGRTSAWTTRTSVGVRGDVAAPTAVSTLTMQTVGDVGWIEWTHTDATADVIGYEVRYSALQDVTDYGQMVVLSSDVPRGARSFAVPSVVGSYGVKAIDAAGRRSATALFVNASLIDARPVNEIAAAEQSPTFSGTKTDTTVVSNSLQLADLVASTTFEPTGTYEWGETDFGSVFTVRLEAVAQVDLTSRLGAISTWADLSQVESIGGDASADDVAVTIEVASSSVDSATPSYGDWRPVAVGDVTARHVKFRVTLTTQNEAVSPVVSALKVRIVEPVRIAEGDDVASGTSTKSITFSPAFRTLKTVQITGQNMATGDYYVVANKSRTGFDVTFKNSGGTNVDRTFDWTATGHGYEQGT